MWKFVLNNMCPNATLANSDETDDNNSDDDNNIFAEVRKLEPK